MAFAILRSYGRALGSLPSASIASNQPPTNSHHILGTEHGEPMGPGLPRKARPIEPHLVGKGEIPPTDFIKPVQTSACFRGLLLFLDIAPVVTQAPDFQPYGIGLHRSLRTKVDKAQSSFCGSVHA